MIKIENWSKQGTYVHVSNTIKSLQANLWSLSNKSTTRIDMSFLNNLNTWMLWSPVWLPMIFVITPPLSEFCNFRTGIFLFLLLFIRWNRGHLGHWSHMLKNAKWTTFLFTILVPRLWPTRIERHCDQCETMLAAQFQMVRFLREISIDYWHNLIIGTENLTQFLLFFRPKMINLLVGN